MVKFISYDGHYPNLCAGTLIFEIKGKEYKIKRLVSGGYVHFDKNWNEYVAVGPWTLGDLPKRLEKYREEITKIANENINHGCCGGCI